MTEVFFSKQDGEIRKKLRPFFEALKDGYWKLTLAPAKQRTSPMNRYLHGVVIPMVFKGLVDMGFNDVKDVEDAKLIIKALFLKKKIESAVTGDVIEIIQDTRKLSTVEMSAFYDEVIQWASIYLNIQIPYPNEKLLLEFGD